MMSTAVEETPMTTPSPDALHQMILNVESNAHDAHRRLRDEIVHLKDQIDRGLSSVRTESNEDRRKFDVHAATLAATPVDATKLVMSTRVIITLIAGVLVIAGSLWNLGNRIDAQRLASENYREMQKIESSTIKSALDGMQRRQELQQYEIQGLKEAIITGKAKPTVR